MKRQWRSLFTFMLVIVGLNAYAANETSDWLVAHPEIRIGVPDDLKPLISLEQGEAVGFDVDMLNAITQGVPLDFIWISCGSWSDCLTALQQHDIDVLPSTSFSTQRATYMSFTQRYWTMPWAALSIHELGEQARRELKAENMRGQRIGVTQGYSIVAMLQHIKQAEVFEYKTLPQGINALSRDAIDVYIDSFS